MLGWYNGEEEGGQDHADHGNVDKDNSNLQFQRLSNALPKGLEQKIEEEVDAWQDDDGVSKAGSGVVFVTDIYTSGLSQMPKSGAQNIRPIRQVTRNLRHIISTQLRPSL